MILWRQKMSVTIGIRVFWMLLKISWRHIWTTPYKRQQDLPAWLFRDELDWDRSECDTRSERGSGPSWSSWPCWTSPPTRWGESAWPWDPLNKAHTLCKLQIISHLIVVHLYSRSHLMWSLWARSKKLTKW